MLKSTAAQPGTELLDVHTGATHATWSPSFAESPAEDQCEKEEGSDHEASEGADSQEEQEQCSDWVGLWRVCAPPAGLREELRTSWADFCHLGKELKLPPVPEFPAFVEDVEVLDAGVKVCNPKTGGPLSEV